MIIETVLTDDDLDKLHVACDAGEHDQKKLCRSVEQAVLKSEGVQRLLRMVNLLDEKIESYERYGGICEFEGEPMIHASHLEELRYA